MEVRILELRGLGKTITLHVLDSTEIEPVPRHQLRRRRRRVRRHRRAQRLRQVVGRQGHPPHLPADRRQRPLPHADGEVVDLATAPDRAGDAAATPRDRLRVAVPQGRAAGLGLEVVAGPLLRRGADRDESLAKARELLERLDLPERLWGVLPHAVLRRRAAAREHRPRPDREARVCCSRTSRPRRSTRATPAASSSCWARRARRA